ncbi:uncharacterized protein [Physcomitrium patens]|uniref:uncharacterized protein isoform X2 n=1 Tax=Physcomitrium patens TaxID=3218 RepID=UPI000D1683A9|nr:uncharacterized protein LOC112282231 isoform X2 [Physcomitrium patens]|eukprot:XP_024375383.1 uncharacterized protein LOC112282231 isoform X2 [Physcomitrella patens]
MDPSNNMSTNLETPNCGTFTCLPSFVAGIVGLALVEFVLVLYLLGKFLKVTSRRSTTVSSDLNLNVNCEDGTISLQGNAWVAPLPNVDIRKVVMRQPRKDKDKDGQREVLRKAEGARGDLLEIAPMRRRAHLKGKILFLRAADGTEEEVLLEDCKVVAVSSSSEPSRKWGKKFPIKLHHPDRVLYRGCNQFLFFSETGYAKEAWCEAFRAMASKEKSDWTFSTKRRYKEYTRLAEVNMPYLIKFNGAGEGRRPNVKQKEEVEGHSKKRMMWKKLTRYASFGRDTKEAKFVDIMDEVQRRKEPQQHNNKNWRNKDADLSDKSHSGTNDLFQGSAEVTDSDILSGDPSEHLGSLASSETDVSGNEGSKRGSESTQKDCRHEVPANQDKVQKSKNERSGKKIEQGVLCLNMIIARLYFDFNQNKRGLAIVHRFFQRLIMKIRIPSYVKSLNVKELDLGKHPPFATAVRMLPADAEGTLAMELDLEWHGGGHLTCETRLDLRDQSAQEKIALQLAESGSESDTAAAVLSGIKGDLGLADSSSFSAVVEEVRHADLPTSSSTGDEGSWKGRWMQSMKSVMSRVAVQVSQVPITLKIRLVSFKGTAVLRLRAPPSDRVWFSFKEDPEINFEPEPCIGDHRISSTALGAYICKQIKVQIRNSVVMPYCESFLLDWMVADKDNWRPQDEFPFPFFVSQASEVERKTSKQNFESTRSPSRDETWSGSSKPQKPASGAHHEQATPLQPSALGLEHHQEPRRSASSELYSQIATPTSPRPASVPHLKYLLSDPAQLQASVILAVGSASISRGSKPLLTDEERPRGETLGSITDSELGASSMGMPDAKSKDCASHSEESSSESDMQPLRIKATSSGEAKESDHGSKLSHRAKMLSLGKKVGNKLDAGRRNVVEKLHH